MAAEILFVRQIELIFAGEVAELRRIQEQVEALLIAPGAKSAKDSASVLKTPVDRQVSHGVQVQSGRNAAGRFSIWNWRLCVPLPSCNVPKFRVSAVVPLEKAAAA